MSKTVEQARNDLLTIIKHLRYAASQATENGKPMLGILSVEPDGGGKIECRLEIGEFLDDLALVIGAPPQTKQDDFECAARKIADMVSGKP